MCGRYANHVQDMHEWAELLGDWPAAAEPGYNVAPTQTVAAARGEPLEAMRWGLVPHWSKTPSTRYATFNARLESVAAKPAYRQAWRQRQLCLIPALGYYEWRTEQGRKQPYFICRESGAPLVFGGLWEQWQADGQAVLSCTILTQPAASVLDWLHPRMPVLIAIDAGREWISGSSDPSGLIDNELPSDLSCYAVSSQVNNARQQGASLIEPLSSQ